MFKITVNTDWFDRSYTHVIIDEFKKRNLYSEDGEIVFNIDSIHNKGIRKGKRLTIYWEIEDFRLMASNRLFYQEADILYIGHKKYLPLYPSNTKVMYLACNPDYHKEVKTDKLFNIVFVGGLEYLPTYYDRITILHSLQVQGENMAILYGKKEEYTKLNSMGRMILNILPKTLEGNAQINARVFEAMAMGCLVTNYDPILDEVITPNIHYIPLDKINLVTDEQIDRIKKTSREYVINSHTWSHRIDQLLKDIDDRLNK